LRNKRFSHSCTHVSLSDSPFHVIFVILICCFKYLRMFWMLRYLLTLLWKVACYYSCVWSLQVLNCQESTIYVLAPLRYAIVYGCSDATIVLGAVGKVNGFCFLLLRGA
jgi:hypothetical protein